MAKPRRESGGGERPFAVPRGQEVHLSANAPMGLQAERLSPCAAKSRRFKRAIGACCLTPAEPGRASNSPGRCLWPTPRASPQSSPRSKRATPRASARQDAHARPRSGPSLRCRHRSKPTPSADNLPTAPTAARPAQDELLWLCRIWSLRSIIWRPRGSSRPGPAAPGVDSGAGPRTSVSVPRQPSDPSSRRAPGGPIDRASHPEPMGAAGDMRREPAGAEGPARFARDAPAASGRLPAPKRPRAGEPDARAPRPWGGHLDSDQPGERTASLPTDRSPAAQQNSYVRARRPADSRRRQRGPLAARQPRRSRAGGSECLEPARLGDAVDAAPAFSHFATTKSRRHSGVPHLLWRPSECPHRNRRSARPPPRRLGTSAPTPSRGSERLPGAAPKSSRRAPNQPPPITTTQRRPLPSKTLTPCPPITAPRRRPHPPRPAPPPPGPRLPRRLLRPRRRRHDPFQGGRAAAGARLPPQL